jgi:heptose-I-phosphate ethanolaminephosphotransferase
MGRNHTDNITWQVAHEEYEIPFWIWYSESYANNHPEVVAAIRKAKDLPFMTDNLPHVLLWLAGISAPYYRADRNLLSPDYDAKRPRLLKGIVDYNTIKQ